MTLTGRNQRDYKVISLLPPQVLDPQHADHHQQVAQHGQEDDHQENQLNIGVRSKFNECWIELANVSFTFVYE